MNKKEFIIEAALRMVSQGMPVMDIPQVARQLADELYPEAPIHHGKSETDSIEVLLKEVDRLEEEDVREKNSDPNRRWNVQKGGYAAILKRVFKKHDISTVYALLSVGRLEFRRKQGVGMLTVDKIDEALRNLYNITTW